MPPPEEPQPTPPAPPPRSFLQRMLEIRVTLLIAAINIAWFLVTETHGGTTDNATLIRFGASERSRLWAGEYWRFVTPIFLHIGWFHLLWNTYMMFGLNAVIERLLGAWRFSIAYLATGIAAVAASVLTHDAISAGASGAGFGMIGLVLIAFYRKAGSYSGFIALPMVKRILLMVALWIVLGFTLMKMMDNSAHLGGFVAGLLLGYVFFIGPIRSRARRMVTTAFVVLLLSGSVIASAHRWPGQKAEWPGQSAAKAGYDALVEKDNERAEKFFTEAISLGCDTYDAYWHRAAARERQGNIAGATEDVRKALEIAPQDWDHRTKGEEWLRAHAPK